MLESLHTDLKLCSNFFFRLLKQILYIPRHRLLTWDISIRTAFFLKPTVTTVLNNTKWTCILGYPARCYNTMTTSASACLKYLILGLTEYFPLEEGLLRRILPTLSQFGVQPSTSTAFFSIQTSLLPREPLLHPSNPVLLLQLHHPSISLRVDGVHLWDLSW